MEKTCVLCGFNRKVELHHIKKYLEYGSDDSSNLVYLCPNHHWLADFGSTEDRNLMLSLIKKLTGKTEVTDISKQKYFEKLIRAYYDYNYSNGIEFSDVEYESQKKTSNYLFIKHQLLRDKSEKKFITQLEILYIISMLKKEYARLSNG